MASHDKKGMIDRKEDETTEKESTLVADVSTTPSQKNCQLPNLPVYLSVSQILYVSLI